MRALRRFDVPASGEAGYTLVELLVAMTMGLVIAGVGMTVLVMSGRTQPQQSERAAQIQQGRVMVERLVRELRQGEAIEGRTESGLSILTKVHSDGCGGPPAATAIPCWVTYQCATDSCTRAVRAEDGSEFPVQLVSGIAGPNVFPEEEGQPPDYVEVELTFPSRSGGGAVTVADGAALRNWTGAVP